MLTYPQIDPIALSVGPLTVHWYGLMYLVGFAVAWGLGRLRARRPGSAFSPEMVDDLIFFSILGVIAGGRLGYMLFYGFDQILANPLNLFRVWEGGMSFHGGLIGVCVALWWFGRRHGLGFFGVADFLAPLVPPGLFFGRIGNFINGELWGGPTASALGMRVPCPRAPDLCQRVGRSGDGAYSAPVHASQLYEAVLEGLVLFVVLWLFTRRPRPVMAASGLFLLLYGVFRFAVEWVRTPDAHLGYLAFGWLTMGQLLSTPMILLGALFLLLAYRRRTA